MSAGGAAQGRTLKLVIAAVTAVLLTAAAPAFLKNSCRAHAPIHLKGPPEPDPATAIGNETPEGSASSHDQYAIIARQEQQAFCAQPRDRHFPRTRLVELPNKVKIHVHPTSDIVSNSIISSRAWESNGVNMALEVLGLSIPGDSTKPLMVDIGANVGTYALSIAKAGYPVVAIEGMETNVKMMRASICDTEGIDQNITLHAMGLGDAPAECVVASIPRNVGDGTVYCGRHAIERAIKSGMQPRGSMQIEVLDNVLKRDVRIMKVDVEGFEPRVLRGARKLFSEHTVWFIQMEYNSHALGLEQSATKDLDPPYQHILDLHRFGYRISRRNFRGKAMNETDIAKLSGMLDLFMVHPKFQDSWWGTPAAFQNKQ